MKYLNLQQFKQIFPNCKEPEAWLKEINDAFTSETNVKNYAAFIAQCGHESGGWRVFEENLNYSAKGLLTTFGKYFNNKDVALYARKPEMIANVVYANRMGNDKPGDGWKYRGRGPIQLTGKDNYKSFSSYYNINVVENPDLILENKRVCLLSAMFYWESNKLSTYTYDFKMLTKKINGGYNGLEEREHLFERVLMYLNDRLLKIGCEGEDVKLIQKRLNLNATGKFDENMLEHIKQIQEKNNLISDGIIGPNTLKYI